MRLSVAFTISIVLHAMLLFAPLSALMMMGDMSDIKDNQSYYETSLVDRKETLTTPSSDDFTIPAIATADEEEEEEPEETEPEPLPKEPPPAVLNNNSSVTNSASASPPPYDSQFINFLHMKLVSQVIRNFLSASKPMFQAQLENSIPEKDRYKFEGAEAIVDIAYREDGQPKEITITTNHDAFGIIIRTGTVWSALPSPAQFAIPYARLEYHIRVINGKFDMMIVPGKK